MTDNRAFLAIELSQDIQLHLREVQQQLSEMGIRCVRWVSTNNIHLTLQFLGETPRAKLDQLTLQLKPVVAAQAVFSFQVQGLGAFPNTHRPRVIWIGLQAPAGLATLQNVLENTVQSVGISVEDRPFSPHLTLGRVKREAAPSEIQNLSLALDELKVGILGSITVKIVTLFRSDLHPDGPVYTAMAYFPLRG
ncbi:MAG: RNA 2',3'-cyclic phosphodiesterase [Bellilinea sp.]